jgi:ABC-2 type transport system permease protein
VSNIFLIAGKEFRSYLKSPMAYIVTCIFLLATGFLFVFYLTSTSYTDTSIRGFVDPGSGLFGVSGPILMLLFAAIITMRLLAEEKKLGTWELLLTSPVRDTEVVAGKFLGSLGVMVGMLVLTLYYPIILKTMGDPDFGPILASYIGLILFGSAVLAIGIFASSLTSNQLVAAVVSGGILFALWFIGIISQTAPKGLQQVLGYISLSSHFPSFVVGIIDTRDVVYYLSITVLFLFLAVRSLESSRWN